MKDRIILSPLRFSVFNSCTVGVPGRISTYTQTPLNILELSYLGHGKSEIEVLYHTYVLTRNVI